MSVYDLPDEPRGAGAVIRVHNPQAKYPEIWVASNINIGDWYPDSETDITGVGIKQFFAEHDGHPNYWDVAKRGRVELLTVGDKGAYREGWLAGCRAAANAAESLEYEEPDLPFPAQDGNNHQPAQSRIVSMPSAPLGYVVENGCTHHPDGIHRMRDLGLGSCLCGLKLEDR